MRWGEFGDSVGLRIAQFGRPVVPGELAAITVEMLMQRLECRERGERTAASALELAERLAGLRHRTVTQINVAKPAMERFEHGSLQRRHRGMIDQFARVHRGQ